MRIDGVWVELGVMPYQHCHDLQNLLLDNVAAGEMPATLLLVEHPPVFSLGAGFHAENLLFPASYYEQNGIEVVETDRGGDVTFHGPRQLVAYPIFNLREHGEDIHLFLRNLEEAVIRAMAEFGLRGERFPPHTGVWLNGRKACAIGIKVRRWVSKHGIALNCDNDLSPFSLIVPCGIKGYDVTSLTKEKGEAIGMEDVRPFLVKSFEDVFEMKLAGMSRSDLESRLEVKPWEGHPMQPGS